MIAYSLYLLFIVSYFLHLTSRISALGAIRFDFVLMFFIFLFTIIGQNNLKNKNKLLKSTKLLLCLVGYVIVSLPLVEWPGSVINRGLQNYSKVVFFFFFTVSLVDTEKKLKIFMLVFLGCQAFRIIEPAYLHITTGFWGDFAYSHTGGGLSKLNRLCGAPHDIVNSTQLGWVVVNTTPFLYYLLWQGNKKLKLVFFAVSLIFLYTLMLTGARSGLVSLLVVIVTIVLMGENKVKRICIGIAFLIPVFIITFGQLSSDMKTRYLSLVDSSVAGADTAAGRYKGWISAFSSVLNRPIVGHGLGTSYETSANELGGRAQIAHNLYLETFQELGLVGFIIFTLFIKSMFSNAVQVRKILTKTHKEKSWLMRLAMATQVWIIMDVVYSLSCFGLNSWEWYLFGGISTSCLGLTRKYYSNNLKAACKKPLLPLAGVRR